VPQKVKFTKQYKPIGFGDRPDPGTVEGHQNAMAEAAETRAYNRRMKELAAEDERKRGGLLSRLMRLFHLEIAEILTVPPCMTSSKSLSTNLAMQTGGRGAKLKQ
jgi:hypothetical protein